MPTNDNANRRELPGGWIVTQPEKQRGNWIECDVEQEGVNDTAFEIRGFPERIAAFVADMNSQPAAPGENAVRGPHAFIADLLASGALDGERSKFYREWALEALAKQPSAAPDAPKDVRELVFRLDSCALYYDSAGEMKFNREVAGKVITAFLAARDAGNAQADVRQNRTTGPLTPQRSAEVERAQVLLAASHLSAEQQNQPAWLWYEHDNQKLAFGRWAAYAKQAPYIRADLLEAAVPQGVEAWQDISTAPKNGTPILGRVIVRDSFPDPLETDWSVTALRWVRERWEDNWFGEVFKEEEIDGWMPSPKALSIPPRPGKDTPDEMGGV